MLLLHHSRCSSPFAGDLEFGEETGEAPSTADLPSIQPVFADSFFSSSSCFFKGLQSFPFPRATQQQLTKQRGEVMEI